MLSSPDLMSYCILTANLLTAVVVLTGVNTSFSRRGRRMWVRRTAISAGVLAIILATTPLVLTWVVGPLPLALGIFAVWGVVFYRPRDDVESPDEPQNRP